MGEGAKIKKLAPAAGSLIKNVKSIISIFFVSTHGEKGLAVSKRRDLGLAVILPTASGETDHYGCASAVLCCPSVSDKEIRGKVSLSSSCNDQIPLPTRR